MMGKKYRQVRDGEWVTPARKGYRLMCCDCGLVHTIDFKLIPRSGGKGIAFRPNRHERATAAARRRRWPRAAMVV